LSVGEWRSALRRFAALHAQAVPYALHVNIAVLRLQVLDRTRAQVAVGFRQRIGLSNTGRLCATHNILSARVGLRLAGLVVEDVMPLDQLVSSGTTHAAAAVR
jgi:hypothetical protein